MGDITSESPNTQALETQVSALTELVRQGLAFEEFRLVLTDIMQHMLDLDINWDSLKTGERSLGDKWP